MLQIYERFDADSMTQADDARLEYFTKKVVLIICLVTSFSWIKYLIFFFVVFLLNESLLILFFFYSDIPEDQRFFSGTPFIQRLFAIQKK